MAGSRLTALENWKSLLMAISFRRWPQKRNLESRGLQRRIIIGRQRLAATKLRHLAVYRDGRGHK